MSHIPYTLRRSGRYYYNRCVPKHVGQYQGKGTLIDRHGEVHEGEFKENLFVG